MSLEWLLIRGSGLVAFGLLALATIWGLLISTKILGRAVKAKGVAWFHESLGIGSLLATIVHMVALSVHDYVDFTWGQILLPGQATWRPLATALGVIGFYTLAIVTLSFYVKSWIGQKAWKTIHHMSFGLFVTILAHGILAGTDTTHPVVVTLYAATAAATVILITVRILQSRQPAPPQRTNIQRAERPGRPVGHSERLESASG
jgi:predicted ferric reductase